MEFGSKTPSITVFRAALIVIDYVMLGYVDFAAAPEKISPLKAQSS